MKKKLKNSIKRVSLVIKIRILTELIAKFRRICNYTGAINMSNNKTKLRADLIIKIHSIEKGLALPNPRIGFGETKIKEILTGISQYISKWPEDASFLKEARPILEAYFNFQKENNHQNEILWKEYLTIFEDVKYTSKEGGILLASKEDIDCKTNIDFKSFLNCRYSIRDFAKQEVDVNLIKEAIRMSEKSPSACNRQPWSIYVFKNRELKNSILEWQMGSQGFTDSIDTAILITCKLDSYFINETNLPYVDGGLYAMTLIYSLHALGLGTIPLTTAMMEGKNKLLYSKFKIADNEVPILIIGVGHLKDKFNVAISHRKPSETYIHIID